MWVEGKVYDRIFSLGTNCRPKGCMRNLEMGCVRGPFDWMYTEKLSSLIEVLRNRFDNWFAPENCIASEGQDGDGYLQVYDEATNYTSNHDFKMLSNDWTLDIQEQSAKFKEKYASIIGEFLKFLKTDTKLLFLMNIEPEWRGQDRAICAATGISYVKLIKELVNEIEILRAGKDSDFLIGTYYEDLIGQKWESNIRFFKLNREWNTFKDADEVALWDRSLTGHYVNDSKMMKGWPGDRPNNCFDGKSVYNRVYSLGCDYLPLSSIRQISHYARRGPFDNLKVPFCSQLVEILKGDFESLFPLEKMTQIESRKKNKLIFMNVESGITLFDEASYVTESGMFDLKTIYRQLQIKYEGIFSSFYKNLLEAEHVLFVLNLQSAWSGADSPICLKSERTLVDEIKDLLGELGRLRNKKPFDIYITTYYEKIQHEGWPSNVKIIVCDKELGRYEGSKEADFWDPLLDDIGINDTGTKRWWAPDGFSFSLPDRRV